MQNPRARKDGISVFTQAFLDSVRGMAARDDEGDWRVSSLSLLEAMDHVSQRLTKAAFPAPQQPQGAESRLFLFHKLQSAPISPVYVLRLDGAACGPGVLQYKLDGIPKCRPCGSGETEVELQLPFGDYDFELQTNGGDVIGRCSQKSAPIYKRAKLAP
jgi:hypothetical protein